MAGWAGISLKMKKKKRKKNRLAQPRPHAVDSAFLSLRSQRKISEPPVFPPCDETERYNKSHHGWHGSRKEEILTDIGLLGL